MIAKPEVNGYVATCNFAVDGQCPQATLIHWCALFLYFFSAFQGKSGLHLKFCPVLQCRLSLSLSLSILHSNFSWHAQKWATLTDTLETNSGGDSKVDLIISVQSMLPMKKAMLSMKYPIKCREGENVCLVWTVQSIFPMPPCECCCAICLNRFQKLCCNSC
jgi:hypothetical protein